MKNFCVSIFMILLLSNISLGQLKTTFGVNANLAVPTGTTSDKYKVGYGGGAFVIIPTSSPSIGITAGADYLNLPGKTVTETSSGTGWWSSRTTTYHSLSVGSIYAGPKFGKQDGLYFLPAISLNFSAETRFGFYLGGGILVSSESIKFIWAQDMAFLTYLAKIRMKSQKAVLEYLRA